MIQHELDDMADIFGVKGLNKLSKIQLPRQDMIALARYLEELKMYAQTGKVSILATFENSRM